MKLFAAPLALAKSCTRSLRGRPQIALVAAMLAVAAFAGCRERASTAGGAAARARAANLSPEESFALILQTFRRGVEDIPISFVTRDASGHSMMTGKNTVSHELIPPAKEGDPYRAFIIVDSKSRYSIQRSAEEQDDEQEQEAEDQNAAAESEDASGVEVLDSDLVSSPGSTAKKGRSTTPDAAKTTVARREEKEVRKYELLYEGGRWILVSKLDPETEQSIQNAFSRALATQG